MECEYRWYIDPLDGTTNFAHGFPAFCVSMGLERRLPGTAMDADGELIAAVIYDPLRDEMFLAEKDQGATLNGKPIHVSTTETLAESLIATGFPSRKRHGNPNVHFYHEFTLRSHGVRRAGSAALDLAYTACGRLDGYWEFKLNSWDTAAGVLLVREAGGKVTYVDGSPFHLVSLEVLASNGKIHGAMIQLFQDMLAGRNLEPIQSAREFAAERAERLAATAK
jgi:myo-inositol-1(or 4)-monophosphatase